jgi:hypothetical protein
VCLWSSAVSASTYNPDVLSCIANLSSDEVFTPPQVVNQILDCRGVFALSRPSQIAPKVRTAD